MRGVVYTFRIFGIPVFSITVFDSAPRAEASEPWLPALDEHGRLCLRKPE